MEAKIDGVLGSDRVVVFQGLLWWPANHVFLMSGDAPPESGPEPLTPAQAREVASALLRAADEAEGVSTPTALDPDTYQTLTLLEVTGDAPLTAVARRSAALLRRLLDKKYIRAYLNGADQWMSITDSGRAALRAHRESTT
ncbi:hypothetical protein [Streptomyces sp. NPDC006638]|uniref:hypothetical protein n=1 Tax=Streptomyces sp. NPDC006638 TaxID=3157183 RepID=UPI0033A66312